MQNAPFSERYRMLGETWADAEQAAQLLEDLKSTVMAQRQTQLGDMPVNRAEQIVKASPEWQDYIEKTVEARRDANMAKIALEALRIEWAEHQSTEATRRAELRMLGNET